MRGKGVLIVAAATAQKQVVGRTTSSHRVHAPVKIFDQYAITELRTDEAKI